MKVSGIAFDAFGTLFNLEGLRQRMYEIVGARDIELFLRFQIRLAPYNWYANAVEPFLDGKRFAADIFLVGSSVVLQSAYDLGMEMTEKQADYIAESLGKLPHFPGIVEGLKSLSAYPLAILSNGTPAGLESLVTNSGSKAHFAHILSVKSAGAFKPAPAVYALGPEAFRAPPEEVILVSANDWDIAAAQMAGLKGAWLARKRKPTNVFGQKMDIVVDELTDLASAIG
jgi:2-haloacid dehalogenase